MKDYIMHTVTDFICVLRHVFIKNTMILYCFEHAIVNQTVVMN